MELRLPLLAALIAFAALAAPAAPAFGVTDIVASGRIVSETRTVKGFSGIRLSLPGTVVLRQAEVESVTVEADDNLLAEIATVLDGASLEIRFKRQLNVKGRPTLRFLVTGPRFDSLALSGDGQIITEALKSRALSISIAGAGEVKIARLEADELTAAIAGSGAVKAAGRADDLTLKIAGSGDMVAGALAAKHAKVTISGSGDATLRVSETLKVTIAGSGDVRFYGDPVVKRSLVGGGSVSRLGPAS